ncbi:lysophosphatidic acid phosphatase type 6 [Corythoichthys intestinalis]|uniref:lysophosphatidic acid phosphatase type 6 n=1 Tax=Corythoichthys intestinalis TaxID=161448 RepID=UPI0025A61886|nr:lysophosphatidic acid phosphatase type 6 [Corythoichthys intestinalis]XP_061799762.1 lysophosphatidic acid phosphatase type 6-like [Nerophis lumbriciformis]
MRKIWTKVGVFGTVSIALGSVWWWRQKNASQYDLKLVQVLFRHGARTPLGSIPDVLEAQWVPSLLEPPAHTHMNYVVTNLDGGQRPSSPLEDSYRKKKLSGGVFAGQLTTLGMQQLYELGERFRRKYVQECPFLTDTFCTDEVYVRSTNIVRTIESARCLLAGLFQQKQKETVPIITTDAESEILYPNYHGCRLLRMLGSPRLKEVSLLPDLAADLKSIRNDLGIRDKSEVDFILIRDDMVARQAHGLPCPPALSTWRKRVEQRAVDVMFHCYQPSNRENLQLCVGPLLHMLLLNMEEKLKGSSSEPNRKLFLYSAHDTTLIPCLMALGIFDMKWPPYAADITLELHQHRRTKEPFVKVSYMGKDQRIPGCSGLYCPLREFQEALSAYSLNNDLHQLLCNSTGDKSKR